MIPILGGDAYGVAQSGSIWYLHGKTAVRVRLVSADSAGRSRFENDLEMMQIQPTSDGGAYAFDAFGGTWRLDADSAAAIAFENVPVVASRPRFSDPLSDLSFAIATGTKRKIRSEPESPLDEDDGR